MCFNLTLEHILRHFSPYMENFFTFAFRFSEQERCLSGRKEQFAKLSYAQQRTGGSNPPLSANRTEPTPQIAGFLFVENIENLFNNIFYKKK
jgi:hypothetical protein